MLKIEAPAKLNLTLEVLGDRPDGYHEIRSIIQSIDLCDSLSFRLSDNITFKSDTPGWNAEESLVSRAASLLQKAAGCSRGAAIDVNKRIPLVAGLGGDSSDAAATLSGLNQLWELSLPQEELLDLAAQLGSDVPFFLYGGTATVAGRGEFVKPLPPLPHMWAVLVVPSIPGLPGKTARLYASLNANHFTDGRITEKLAAEIRKGGELSLALLFNTFENVAFDVFSAELKTYRAHILKLGAPHVHLAGSGPTLFTLLKDKAQAEDLYTRCKNQGMETYVVGVEGQGDT